MDNSMPPDQGYSWMILFSSSILFGCQACSYSTIGVYLVEFEEYFEANIESLSWIVSLKMGTVGFGSLVGSHLVKLYGSRVVAISGCILVTVGYILASLAISITSMYLTFGILTGFGYGFYVAAVPSILHNYFLKRKALAFGIATASLSVGSFTWPSLAGFILRYNSLRIALLIQAAIHIHSFIPAMLLTPIAFYQRRKRHDERINTNDALLQKRDNNTARSTTNDFAEHHLTSDTSSREIDTTGSKRTKSLHNFLLPLQNAAFVFYIAGQFCIQGGHVAFISFIPLKGVSLGASHQLSAFLVSMLGISGGIGRILSGIVGDRIPNHRILLSATSSFIGGGIALCTSIITSYKFLSVSTISYGFLSAPYVAFYYTVVGDILEPDLIPHATGLLFFISVTGSSLTVPPLTGKLVDATGSFTIAFLLFGFLIISSGILFIISYMLIRRQRRIIRNVLMQENVIREKNGLFTTSE